MLVFFGMFYPCFDTDGLVMMMSFLISGFVIGHAGLFHSLIMMGVAYVIVSMTILSICAISTNGAIQAGGAYCILLALHCLIRAGLPPDGPIWPLLIVTLTFTFDLNPRASHDQSLLRPRVRGQHRADVLPGQCVWLWSLCAGPGWGYTRLVWTRSRWTLTNIYI